MSKELAKQLEEIEQIYKDSDKICKINEDITKIMNDMEV